MRKAAVYTGTRNLYTSMVPAVKSIIANSDVDAVYLLIEDGMFPIDMPPMVTAIDVSGQQWFKPGGPNYGSGFTYMAMMRAVLCHVLEEDMVLSLDVDTCCVRDVSDVWELPLDGAYLAASHEPTKCRGGAWHQEWMGDMYCNTGVALYDLARLRDGKADEVVEMLNSRRLTFVEQDAMNIACGGHIADMPSEYNANPFTEPCAEPRIIHWAGMRLGAYSKQKEYLEYAEMPWPEVWSRRERTCG